MTIVYSLLIGIVGAAIGAGLGIGAGLLIVKITHMSSFEGKSGYFVGFCMLAGIVLGFVASAIGAGIYFRTRAG